MKRAANVDLRLDASGLSCPEPVLRTRLALAQMDCGEVLEVIATDPLAEVDLSIFCERTGHRLLFMEQEGPRLVAQIKKARLNCG